MTGRARIVASGLVVLLSSGPVAAASMQPLPSVAVDAQGNVVVMWESFASTGSDIDGSSIQGQRYDAAGAPVGAEFQVNSFTAGQQGSPAVASRGAGSFVVVWQSLGSSGSPTTAGSIQGQRYDAAGMPLGAQFQVSDATPDEQRTPAVAIDGTGRFVVVWESLAGAGSIQAQRYDGAGVPAGAPFTVSARTAAAQSAPAVTTDGRGNIFVAWVSGGTSIQGRRYDDAGTSLGSQFQVSVLGMGARSHPGAALDADGDVVVTWSGRAAADTDAMSSGRQGQRYGADGAPRGSQFTVPPRVIEPPVASEGSPRQASAEHPR